MQKKQQESWLKSHWRLLVCIFGLALLVIGLSSGVAYRVHQHNVMQNRIEWAEHSAKSAK